jgi:hypothetical protein
MAVALPDDADPGAVNPHYLGHVVRTAALREVEATEDILAGNGMKLVSKGTRIDEGMRERLLQHKLRKPLEQTLTVRGAIVADGLRPVAERLLEHHPLLQSLCAPARTQSLPLMLSTLPLLHPVQSLLTVYADYQGGRLAHSVGVAMLALGLARKLLLLDVAQQQQLALAGLLHDLGELYIDSSHMHSNAPLQAAQWRHIAAHPVVGWRVLRDVRGMGPAVAEMILNHHERIDGFGYPRGLQGDAFPMLHQMLAAAEWLMALIDGGSGALARASVASRLIPGEFSPALVDLLDQAARQTRDAPVEEAPLMNSLPALQQVVQALERFQGMRAWMQARIDEANPALASALQMGLTRLTRIQASLSSTGLDLHDPEALLRSALEQNDRALQQELRLLAGEFSWRLRQLEREALLRAGLLCEADLAVVRELVERLRGSAVAQPEGQGV